MAKKRVTFGFFIGIILGGLIGYSVTTLMQSRLSVGLSIMNYEANEEAGKKDREVRSNDDGDDEQDANDEGGIEEGEKDEKEEVQEEIEVEENDPCTDTFESCIKESPKSCQVECCALKDIEIFSLQSLDDECESNFNEVDEACFGFRSIITILSGECNTAQESLQLCMAKQIDLRASRENAYGNYNQCLSDWHDLMNYSIKVTTENSTGSSLDPQGSSDDDQD